MNEHIPAEKCARARDHLMPDMKEFGAHFQCLLDDLRYKKLDLRQQASKLLTQAEVYESIEFELRNAIDVEKAKLPAVGKEGGQ